MKATQAQFEIISGVLDLGLSKIEAGGNDLQGFLEECAQFATECRDTYALWLLLKIGRAHKYPAGDSWAFNDELEEAGSTLNDTHILTAMKKWLAGKLEEVPAPDSVAFNSHDAVLRGLTTGEQARKGLDGFLVIVADIIETNSPEITIDRIGFGDGADGVFMPPLGSLEVPASIAHFNLRLSDTTLEIEWLTDQGAVISSMPLSIQTEQGACRPVVLGREEWRRAYGGAPWGVVSTRPRA